MFIGSAVSAQSSNEMKFSSIEDKLIQLEEEKLSEKEKCEKKWNILWEKAKAGSREARAHILLLIAPYPHQKSMTLPNHDLDARSNLRNSTIFSVYSLGANLSLDKRGAEYSLQEAYLQKALTFLTDEAFQMAFPEVDARYFRNEAFLKCVVQKNLMHQDISQCADEFSEEELIPNFDEFAKEIDSIISSGQKPTCHNDQK
tara:strand:+ start:921 stop:1523 length:603 start_codon:yes stop_codon:yes gene_type:complete